MSYKLIVTADDYGMCETVNAAVEECLSAGTVRATCIMVNMPAAGAAISLPTQFPHGSLGLHWNLTQGYPVLSPARIPSLVKPDGRFYSSAEFRPRWLMRRISLAEIRAELFAQYERFCSLVGTPAFWNTHQNVHVWPGVFRHFVAVGQELHIPAMRCHKRIMAPSGRAAARYHVRHPVRWLKGQIISAWSVRARSMGTRMPDGVVFAPGYANGMADIEAIIRHLGGRRVPPTAEMVIHPATTSDDVSLGRLTESRVREYKVFRDPTLVQRLGSAGVDSVGFEALI